MADVKNTQNNTGAVSSSGVSRLALIRNVTRDCLMSMSDDDLHNPQYVEATILNAVQVEIDVENSIREKYKWKPLHELIPSQIADIIYHTYSVVRVVTAGDINSDSSCDMLAIYCEAGPNMGIYSTSLDIFNELARSYDYALSIRGFEEMMNVLRGLAKKVLPCSDANLIAVNNGIFDYDTKTLLPFSPDMVFLSKSRVDYNDQATNVVIHNPEDGTDWDLESWMNELNDDADVVNTLWEVLGAIVRPNVSWGCAAWFYSETGNNGKGTLCSLMRNLCGDGSYASIPLADMGKDFMLEPLTHSSAIIVDENDVGTYIDKAANLKAIITNDVISINRKFKQPLAYVFHGFMVQCLNEMPRIKDKTDSFYRRQLFIPFLKCFTGAERKYIKNDYLKRKEVLEYALYRVLNMNYYKLSVPQACKDALEEYKDFVDPVREFMKEHMPLFKWDLLPFRFMYDCYCAWYKAVAGNDRGQKSLVSFKKDVKVLVDKLYTNWEFVDVAQRPADRMDEPEPLIDEYHLDDWMNARYRGSKDWEKRCLPNLKSTYRGLKRRQRQLGSDMDNDPAFLDDDGCDTEETV